MDLKLPKFNGKIGIPIIQPIKIPDLFGILLSAALRAILKLILDAILQIISKILSALGDGVCETPSNFGIEDIPASELRTIIKNTIPIQGGNHNRGRFIFNFVFTCFRQSAEHITGDYATNF